MVDSFLVFRYQIFLPCFSDRRAVYSFLNTLNDEDDYTHKEKRLSKSRRRKSPSRIHIPALNSSNHPLQRRMSHNSRPESRASKHDLEEILESLER
jgi:hypothetical protein